MQIRQGGLRLMIDDHSGNCYIRYVYPIKSQYFNVFKSQEESFGMIVQETKREVKGKVRTRYQCSFDLSGNSLEIVPKFRKIQAELMLLSRNCKLNQLKDEITYFAAKVSNLR